MASFIFGTKDGSVYLTPVVVNSSAATITPVAAVTGQIIRVYKLFLVFGGTSNITFQDGAGTALSGAIPVVANGSISLDLDGHPWFTGGLNQSFQIVNSGSVSVNGTIYFTQTGFTG